MEHMIHGIGIDIEDVQRFRKHLNHKAFLKRVFTHHEMTYCQRFRNPLPHLAVRFAAKEAYFKAIQKKNIKFTDIEVRNHKGGSPYFIIYTKSISQKFTAHLSLSHTEDKAMAICVLVMNS